MALINLFTCNWSPNCLNLAASGPLMPFFLNYQNTDIASHNNFPKPSVAFRHRNRSKMRKKMKSVEMTISNPQKKLAGLEIEKEGRAQIRGSDDISDQAVLFQTLCCGYSLDTTRQEWSRSKLQSSTNSERIRRHWKSNKWVPCPRRGRDGIANSSVLF